MILQFSESFAEQELVHFQLVLLGSATYAWIGTEEGRQDVIAMGVPSSSSGGSPASGTMLLGAGVSDGASQTMAQRLARKLGQPVFVSMNLGEDKDGMMRLFAERQVLEALKRSGVAPAAGSTSLARTPRFIESSFTTKDVYEKWLKSQSSTSIAASSTLPLRGGGDVQSSASSAGPPHPTAIDASAGVGVRTFDIFDDAGALGDQATALLLEAAREAIDSRGSFSVALSGGSIPKLLCPSLLSAKATARFERWHLFLVDERYVPSEHADNTLRVWTEALLQHVGIPKAQVHGLNTSVSLGQAALEYEADLLRVVGGSPPPTRLPEGQTAEPPKLDALLLGMGPDGHTASLFPDHPLLADEGRWVAPIANSPKPPSERVTLTLPVLNAARLALFICTGASKADCVKRAFLPEPDVPAGLVLATQRTHWLLDSPAAADLVAELAKQEHMYT